MRKIIAILCILLSVQFVMAQTKSYKRGLALDQNKTTVADFKALAPSVTWFYNWSTSAKLDGNEEGIVFVPMTWNGGYNTNDLRNYLKNHPEVDYLLAFNEPNFKDQANMTPSQAAKAWPALQAIADEFNLKLVSPAPNWCGWCVEENGTTYNSPYDWLRDFLKECKDCRVDYIGIHFYMGAMEAVKGSIEQLYNQFGKPIWLTEFNMDKNGMGDNGTVDEQRDFMVKMIDWMEQDPRIYRYSWFLTRGGILPDLMASTRGQLATLGKIYAHMSSYDTNYWHSIADRIEAEHYVRMSNLSLVESTDKDGNLSVGYTQAGSSLYYQIDVPATDDYTLTLRTAGEQQAILQTSLDGKPIANIQIPASGAWTNWQDIACTIPMTIGQHTLTLTWQSGSCDINWIKLSNNTQQAIEQTQMQDHHPQPQKIIRNGQLFIRHQNTEYDILGRRQ